MLTAAKYSLRPPFNTIHIQTTALECCKHVNCLMLTDTRNSRWCWLKSPSLNKNAFYCYFVKNAFLTHWDPVTHICVGKLTIIGSDNGLSPERRQAIIWTDAGILLIGRLGTNFSEILIEIQTFSLKKIHLKMSSAKCCSFRLGLNVLTYSIHLLTFWRWQN